MSELYWSYPKIEMKVMPLSTIVTTCGIHHLLLHCNWLLFWLAVTKVNGVLSNSSCFKAQVLVLFVVF